VKQSFPLGIVVLTRIILNSHLLRFYAMRYVCSPEPHSKAFHLQFMRNKYTQLDFLALSQNTPEVRVAKYVAGFIHNVKQMKLKGSNITLQELEHLVRKIELLEKPVSTVTATRVPVQIFCLDKFLYNRL